MQCPLCGKEVEVLHSGICAQCASEKRPFLSVPEVVDIIRCAHCGKIQRRGVWKRGPEDQDATVVQSVKDESDVDPSLSSVDVEVEIRWEDDRNATAHVGLDGEFQGHAVEREGDTRVRLKTSVCNDCSREYGGYFEAIVQVRAEDERVLEHESDSVLRWIRQEMERFKGQDRPGAFLSKTERVRGGFDLYAGSHEVAKLLGHGLAERYGALMTESSKLVGRKDGRDLTRTTTLVRLPGYLPGDFLRIEGRLFKLLRVDGRRLNIWDLERGEPFQREARRLKDLKVVGTAKDEVDAVVVSRHGRSIQVLDPATLKTVDLEVPPGFPEAPTVRVFRHEDRLWIIPPEAQK